MPAGASGGMENTIADQSPCAFCPCRVQSPAKAAGRRLIRPSLASLIELPGHFVNGSPVTDVSELLFNLLLCILGLLGSGFQGTTAYGWINLRGSNLCLYRDFATISTIG